ncbi:MAG: sigma-54-dependent Fis family transcriptional regulator [Deltaproteobacteria bacterium]|nr:sigma-54-dependent Fis family transcriptional regulator [Deltaproteobacteria bacterium]
MAYSVLVVDDEVNIRKSLQGVLSDEGYRVIPAETGELALDVLSKSLVDAVLLDVWLPGMDGLEALRHIRETYPMLPVIMISGHGTIDMAVKAVKNGAFDFIEKPISLDKLLITLSRAIEREVLRSENVELKEREERKFRLVGSSEVMQALRAQIAAAGPTNASVLVSGENGSGKEIVAREIHRHSRRANKPFVAVNCAAIPEELIESELFGHERGAFTGATGRRRGRFELADGGTLFLDEVGDMSPRTQAKILRVLEERAFERIGGGEKIRTDVRIIAATNRNLPKEVGEGRFREDLFFRLNVFPILVPPLRDHKEDISRIAAHFVGEICADQGKERKEFSGEAMERLLAHPWPGNIRELRNVLERLVILTMGRRIEEETVRTVLAVDLPRAGPSLARALAEESFREAILVFEKEYLERKLRENDFNVSRTAERLGLDRTSIHRKMKQLGIPSEGGRR